MIFKYFQTRNSIKGLVAPMMSLPTSDPIVPFTVMNHVPCKHHAPHAQCTLCIPCTLYTPFYTPCTIWSLHTMHYVPCAPCTPFTMCHVYHAHYALCTLTCIQEDDWLLHLTLFQIPPNHSLYWKLGLLFIKVPKAPLHHLSKSFTPPKWMNKQTVWSIWPSFLWEYIFQSRII